MKNIVIAVSPDSSLELLGVYADVIVLDKGPIPSSLQHYDTLYIRSHFGQAATLPEVYRTEIDLLVQLAKQANPDIKFIDDTYTIDKILAVEDKWLQYTTYGDFMPKTQLLGDELDTSGFERPVFKNRLSSHGNGVTWNIEDVTQPVNDWLIQESLDITEELRVYIIHGKVYPLAAVRQSKTLNQSTQAVDARTLTQEEIEFSTGIGEKSPDMSIVGIDIARTSAGKLYLLEVNRSPGFGKFAELTGVNLARFLYDEEF